MNLQASVDKTHRYAGPERRKYPRIQANFPICVRFVSSSGEDLERYAQTKDVSAEGILFSCMVGPEPGTEIEVLMGIPSAYAVSLPAAQLNGMAVVTRSEPVGPDEEDGFGNRIALRFVKKPTLSTEVSMFD